MGFFEWIKRLFGSREEPLPPPEVGLDVGELARRLGVTPQDLRSVAVAYQPFVIPKRSGGSRQILAPAPALKAMQRRILRRLLGRLRVHPAAMGFRPEHSIVTHARQHVGQAVVVRMDLRDFFPATTSRRVMAYFRRIGWNQEATDLLVRLCTHEGGLPQGAPTSPALSNLVNYRLDARLDALAHKTQWSARNPKTLAPLSPVDGPGIVYSRYADDLTFSFDRDDHTAIQRIIWVTQRIVEDEGYRLHTRKKLRIMRRHDRQVVTGLVVNQAVTLPRATRRRLRAIEHHLAQGKPASLTAAQLQGWAAMQHMIAIQGQAG